MKSRRKALVLLAALVACVVSAIIQSFDASALTSIEGVYNQSYSTLEGNLVIKDDMIPTDVILDENKVGFYYACYNHYVAKNKKTNQHPEWSGYSITFSGRTASAFDCYAKDAGSKTNLVFQGEDRGNSFTIAWDHGNSMTEGTWTYNNADDYIKIVSSEAAVDVQTGAAYDIYMIFSNINVRMYDCVKADGDTTLASIAYGWGNNMGSSYTNLAGMSFLTGKSIEGKSRCRSGTIILLEKKLMGRR